jgi:hypothetical protein
MAPNWRFQLVFFLILDIMIGLWVQEAKPLVNYSKNIKEMVSECKLYMQKGNTSQERETSVLFNLTVE